MSNFSTASTGDASEKRTCQRIQLNRHVQVNLASGQVISGFTDDISLGGIKVSISEPIDDIALQDSERSASLQIKMIDGRLSNEFVCSVVRYGESSISLQMDRKKAAAFGLAITSGVLKKK